MIVCPGSRIGQLNLQSNWFVKLIENLRDSFHKTKLLFKQKLLCST